jgi:hypothetical protein
MIKPKATTKSTKPTAISRRRRAAKPEHARVGRLLLEDVTSSYLNSGDFNGIRALELAHRLGQPWPDIKQIIAPLIEKELVGVLDEKSDINPAIIRIGFEPKDVQLKKLDDSNLDHTFIYPRTAHLKTAVDPFNYAGRPYVLELALGNPQLSFRSFDLSVLEFYRNDPRYSYENRDIDGLISIRDEFYKSDQMPERDQILLQSFGFSFDAKLNRAVAVFLRYLADLSPEHQQIWNAKELSESYKLHPDYFRYSILGDWGERFPIFIAFLKEIYLVNRMANSMERPNLFRQEFGEYGEKKPARFTFLVRPTLEEFNDFILLLDKMLSDNLNKDFFRNEVPTEWEEQRADGKIIVRQKGTLTILNDWLRQCFKTSDWGPWDESLKWLREIRSMRQEPAHAVNENVFDQKYIHEQRKVMIGAYSALRVLRSAFARHPNVKAANIEIPEWLEKGLIWTY